MKKIYPSIAILALLAGCASVPQKLVPHSSFVADDFIRVEMQYANPEVPIGVSTYGPAKKAFDCNRDGNAQAYPGGTYYNNTCLHIMFGGPLPNGAVVVQPSALRAARPLGVVLVAVEYGPQGNWIGASALHTVADADTCKFQANDIKDSNYKDGTVAKGNSLLIYCVGIPMWDPPKSDETVEWKLAPSRPWNPIDNTAFQGRAL